MQIQPNLAAGNPQVAQLATPDRFGPLEIRPSKIVQAATIHRFGSTTNLWRSDRLTISRFTWPQTVRSPAWNLGP
jgi:hypothetical protein